MRTIEANGKSIDEAIFNGLQQLELSIDEVDIEIVQQESKGVLGFGAKPAVVRLIERDPQDVIIPEYLTEEARMQRAQRERTPREGRGRFDRDRRDRRGSDRPNSDRPMAERNAHTGRGGREEAPRSYDDERPRYGAQAEENAYAAPRRERDDRRDRRSTRPAVDYTAEAAQDNPAAEFLTGLLGLMGVKDASVTANVSPAAGEEAAHNRLCINAENMGVLIGHRGETLDAIQYLTSLCVNRSRKEQGYTRITIDTEGYRDKREETLTRLARKVASQVKATGTARTLEPMNPYERRVMHATLQNNPYVTTHSEGEEPFRRVVVEPKK